MIINLQNQLFKMILEADRSSANVLLDNWAEHKNYNLAITSILEPVLKRIGEEWMKEKISLAQGYMAGKIAEDILEKAASQIKIQSKLQLGSIVVGNIEDDYHAFGRKLVTTFLRARGWNVYDLGNDVLPEEFVKKALEVDARVIGASAMMYSTAKNIKYLRKEINERNLKDRIKLAVGGAVFILRPELVEELGGDGTSKNAISSHDLIMKLYKEATIGIDAS